MSLSADFSSALDAAVLFERALGMGPMAHQTEYLRSSDPLLILKGRQTGFTTAAAVKAVHLCWYWPNTLAAFVSPSQKQSENVARIARQALRGLGARLDSDAASNIGLANGSRIVSLPGSAKSVRGFTADLLVIDEAAYVLPETFTAALALCATGGRLIVQSTPADETGAFYDLVNGDDPEWVRIRVRSDEMPTISAAWLEAQRRQMSPDDFATEYELAFGRSGASLFTADRLADLILKETPA